MQTCSLKCGSHERDVVGIVSSVSAFLQVGETDAAEQSGGFADGKPPYKAGNGMEFGFAGERNARYI